MQMVLICSCTFVQPWEQQTVDLAAEFFDLAQQLDTMDYTYCLYKFPGLESHRCGSSNSVLISSFLSSINLQLAIVDCIN
jgi:hypothetical protein